MEADEVGLRMFFAATERGLRTQINGGGKGFALHQLRATGINALRRQALVLGLEIRSGKAESGAATRSRAHSAEKSEGSTEHFRGIGKLPRNNGRANPAAADPLAVKKHRLRIIEENFPVETPPGEQSNVPRAVFTETPIRADGNGLERGKGRGQFLEKIGRLLLGAGGIEGEGYGQPNLPTFQDTELVGQSGNEQWMFFRMQNRQRMIPESQHRRMSGNMRFFPSENDAPMA